MFNNIVYLHEQNSFLANEKKNCNQNEFYQYISTGEFVDKSSFYNIQDFDKKNKSLIRLY
ncbi:MAG TPA: hypothetical protein VJ962_03895 [Clostridia bacterium]|nr:hypothetical protein [Clostridia bacterium]